MLGNAAAVGPAGLHSIVVPADADASPWPALCGSLAGMKECRRVDWGIFLLAGIRLGVLRGQVLFGKGAYLVARAVLRQRKGGSILAQ